MDADLLSELELVLRNEDATFEDLIQVAEVATLLLAGFKSVRDRALVAADQTGPYANRSAMGKATGLKPSSLLRILERNGRPVNRRKAAL